MDNLIEYKGYTIEVRQDENVENPREWEPIGKMVCFHGRYELGDKHGYDQDNFNSWNELQQAIVDDNPDCIIFSLYLYDHSGLRIKIGSFNGLLPQGHAEFDSGQVGFIYMSKKDMEKSNLTVDEAIKVLESEVKIYDQYLSGDVYGYIVSKQDTCKSCEHTENEEIDSLWGIYGYEEAIAEAKQAIDYLVGSEATASV